MATAFSQSPAPPVVAAAQAEVHRLHQIARQAPYAPIHSIDTTWRRFQQRTAAATAPMGTNPNSAADHAARHALYAIALEAQEFCRGILRMPEGERQAAWIKDRDASTRAQIDRIEAASIASASRIPQWSATENIAALARRGISLSVDKKGHLLASPATLLTAADRELLRQHKAAHVAALADAEVVA